MADETNHRYRFRNERAPNERTPPRVDRAIGEFHVQPRSRMLNGGLDPSEMGRRSGEARRAKKMQRERDASDNALTVRQRIGVALSRLTQEELDTMVRGLAQRGNAHALARLADQAFGPPQPAEEDRPSDASLADLTREQRAALWAWLDELDEVPETEEPRSASEDDL
jgi:hypothetical protein